jgi:peptide/nickel transport system permease protein
MNNEPRSSFRESPLYKAWRRLRKNKPAVMSLCLIIVAIFIAIFAPLIAPDKTPDANDQVLELANKNPGFKTTMLLVRKNREEAPSNIFTRIANGRENPCKMLPITSFKLVDSEIVASLYKGDFLPPVEQRFHLADIAFPLSADMPEIRMQGDVVHYTLYNGSRASVKLSDLQNLIEKQHIKTQTYWLGTDNYGRDILSRLLFGVRVSVSVGFVAVLIALTIGVTLGSIAGYFRGFLDNSIMWLINVIWAVPTILLAMALTFALDTRMDRFWVIYIAVGLSMWVEVARIVRGQVMSVREMEYVQAARGLGYSHARIIFRHILPNIIGPIMVIAAADFASAILIEAGLSLVGIGVRPPMPSWGVMLNEHHNYLFIPEKAFLALAPGIAIMILVLAFNLLGNGLRDAFDVKGKLQ